MVKKKEENKLLNKYENVFVDDLIPYARNARKHSEKQIAQVAGSIKEFGFLNPVLVDKDNMLIAGHCRILAAHKLKLKYVPCLRIEHLTENQKKAYILADNKLALNSEWDDDLLKLELEELRNLNFDFDIIGFDGYEFENIEAIEMPELADGDKKPIQQMTFTLHDSQAEIVKSALEKAKNIGKFVDELNENSNGNALARICESFL